MADPETPEQIRASIAALQTKLANTNRPILQGMTDALKSDETNVLISKLQDGAANFDPNSNIVQQTTQVVTMLRNLTAAVDREIIALGPITTT